MALKTRKASKQELSNRSHYEAADWLVTQTVSLRDYLNGYDKPAFSEVDIEGPAYHYQITGIKKPAYKGRETLSAICIAETRPNGTLFGRVFTLNILYHDPVKIAREIKLDKD